MAFDMIVQIVVFIFMVIGLFGLLIPIFPGLTIMWLGPLFYAVVQGANDQMNWLGWTLFILISLLMIVGNVIDNFIIAKHVRDHKVPWSSILFAFGAGLIASIFFTPLVGIIASPTGLYLAELRRVRDRNVALATTKAWMTGWGWSIAARIGIGILMIILWVIWAWV